MIGKLDHRSRYDKTPSTCGGTTRTTRLLLGGKDYLKNYSTHPKGGTRGVLRQGLRIKAVSK